VEQQLSTVKHADEAKQCVASLRGFYDLMDSRACAQLAKDGSGQTFYCVTRWNVDQPEAGLEMSLVQERPVDLSGVQGVHVYAYATLPLEVRASTFHNISHQNG